MWVLSIALLTFPLVKSLHRSWHFVESFAASFVAMNFIGGVR